MKFVLYIDYLAGSTSYTYIPMQAKSLEAAISEADEHWSDNIYLARIMKQYGKAEKREGCKKVETYRALLCRRSFGWHLNNAANSEGEHFAERLIGKGWEAIECVNPPVVIE